MTVLCAVRRSVWQSPGSDCWTRAAPPRHVEELTVATATQADDLAKYACLTRWDAAQSAISRTGYQGGSSDDAR